MADELEEINPSLQTFYYPSTPGDTQASGLDYSMEGGIHGAGKFSDVDLRNHTLEKFKAGESPFVAVAMPGEPTGKEFRMMVHGLPVIAKNLDTGGGLREGQVDIATSNPRLAKVGGTGGGGRTPLLATAPGDVNVGMPLAPIPALNADIPDLGSPQTDVQSTIDQVPQRALMASTDNTDAAVEQATMAGQDMGTDEAPVAMDEVPPKPSPSEEGFVPPPAPNQRVQVVKREGRMTHFADGTILDSGNKTISWTDPAGNMWSYGPNMDKPVKIKSPGSAPKIITSPVTGEMFKENDDGTLTKVDVPSSAAQQQEVTQEDFEKLPFGDKKKVEAYASYKLPISPYGAGRDKELNRLFPYVMYNNPNFDASEYQAKRQAMLEYSRTSIQTAGGQLIALNKALHHLGTLYDLSDQMVKTPLPGVNSLGNWVSTEVGKKYKPQYDTALEAVATEMARYYQGGVPSLQQIADAKQQLGAQLSPEQAQGVLKETVPNLLGGALQALEENYKFTVNKDLPYNKVLNPATRESMKKMGLTTFAGHDLNAEGGSQPESQSQAAPQAFTPGQVIKSPTTDKPFRVGDPYVSGGRTRYYKGGNPDDPNSFSPTNPFP